jgi:hypothetical protein
MIVVATLFSTAAYADCAARKNTELPCDPNLVRSGYYAREEYYAQLETTVQTERPFTTSEINRALDFFGRPNLGTSRILHNDKSHESESTKTYTESTITYHSGNK